MLHDTFNILIPPFPTDSLLKSHNYGELIENAIPSLLAIRHAHQFRRFRFGCWMKRRRPSPTRPPWDRYARDTVGRARARCAAPDRIHRSDGIGRVNDSQVCIRVSTHSIRRDATKPTHLSHTNLMCEGAAAAEAPALFGHLFIGECAWVADGHKGKCWPTIDDIINRTNIVCAPLR